MPEPAGVGGEVIASGLPNVLPEPSVIQKLRFGFDPERFFAGARRRHGDVFTVRVFDAPWTMLADPGAVKEVFAHGPGELNSGEANLALRPLIGTRSVFLADGEEHLRRRKLVLPPFHGERMRAYEATIREMAVATISSWPLDRPDAALPRLQALTFGVILRCVFGLGGGDEVEEFGTSLRRTLDWVTDMRRVLMLGFLGPERVLEMRRFQAQLKAVDRRIEDLIDRRSAEQNLTEREDILSPLDAAAGPRRVRTGALAF